MANQKTGGGEYYRRIKRAFGPDSTDTEIAKRLNTTRQAVSLWKTGKSEPEGNKLIRAAEITGIRQEWFTTGDDRYFTKDTSLRPYSGPEHERLAAVIDSEFWRVAREEGIQMDELVAEVAETLNMPTRNLYNYRSGKWSAPASIIPILSMRFRSTALIEQLLGEHVSVAIKPLLVGIHKQMKGSRK